jgi:hypothetical protein
MHRLWAEERASVALRYLRDALGNETKSTVIMLQEVRNESLRAILNDQWVQRNFALSNADRPRQLALISAILKGKPPSTYKIPLSTYKIAAGLVGGDMNSIDKAEHELHKREDIDLKDVWEDVPAPPIPKLKPFQRDLTFGRAKGNTYGYQSDANRARQRLDKFFHSGALETIPLDEFDATTGRLSRLGLGLKTEVDAWEWISSPRIHFIWWYLSAQF